MMLDHNKMRYLPLSVRYMGVAALVMVACVLMDTKSTQSPVWYGPFFSAAANISIGEELRIDLEEVKRFKSLSVDEREAYRFRRSSNTIPYRYNDVGYAYAVAVATTVFPWLSDQMAIEALQIIIHALSCTLVLYLLSGTGNRVAFLILYALNPVVIRFVTFPFYYFWQAIPAFILVFILLWDRAGAKDRSYHWTANLLVVLYAVLLGITLAARPSVSIVVVVVFVVAFIRTRIKWRAVVLAGISVAIAWLILVPPTRNFWFTAYVGLGAYPNSFGVNELSDDVGYKMYETKTGQSVSASLGGNLYEADTMDRFKEVTRDEFVRIARHHPATLIRNALLNTLQAYSVGYISGAPPWAHYFVALTGAVFIVGLLITRQYLIFLCIGLSVGTFTLYYPPIPAYMYGAYLLIVLGLLRIAAAAAESDAIRKVVALQPKNGGK